jgi:hypothetical protein
MYGFREHPIATAIGVAIILGSIGGIYKVGFEHGIRVANNTKPVISSIDISTFKKVAEAMEEPKEKEEEDGTGISDPEVHPGTQDGTDN